MTLWLATSITILFLGVISALSYSIKETWKSYIYDKHQVIVETWKLKSTTTFKINGKEKTITIDELDKLLFGKEQR